MKTSLERERSRRVAGKVSKRSCERRWSCARKREAAVVLLRRKVKTVCTAPPRASHRSVPSRSPFGTTPLNAPPSLLKIMAATTSDQPASDVNLYEQIDRYPWESDEDFKAGLEAILGSNPSTEQAVELSLRARCFYYARFTTLTKLMSRARH